MSRYLKLFLLCCAFFLQRQDAFSAEQKWNEHRSAHFVIYYRSIPMDFIKTVERAAEDHYQEIAKGLGFRREESWLSENRARIFIYEDLDDYKTGAMQYQWSHGAAFAAEKTIRTFPAAHGFFDSTLPHEMGHIILREFIGLEPEVPLWFEEGVAMYQEKAKRFGANRVVKNAVENGEFIPLKQLTNMRLYSDSPPQTLELFYAESASVVYYMISQLGEHNFVRFCRALKDGKSFTDALKDVYVRFRNLDDLNRSWLNYLEQIKS
jgi:hypothetical protein